MLVNYTDISIRKDVRHVTNESISITESININILLVITCLI